ncbi:MAG: hypothetical protein EXQ89_00035 [Rhodospirillaceae bacterium]|nr:hypothetical protein [Rhodospirillaceae bacterium]
MGTMRRRITVIHNPAAGRRSRRWLRSVLKDLGRAGVVATLETTARRGDAEALGRGLEAGSCEALAVAGGDGTVNEVANGLEREGPPLAHWPLERAALRHRALPRPAAPAEGCQGRGDTPGRNRRTRG